MISDITKTDAFSVVRSLRFIRNQQFFKAIEKKKIIFWLDCGTHFRCAELNHYFFKELASENILVTTNFHCEQHGKSCRYFLKKIARNDYSYNNNLT